MLTVRLIGSICCVADILVWLGLVAILLWPAVPLQAADYVIHVSVDGLNSQLMQEVIDAGNAPTLKRLQHEGVSTKNARTDFTHTNTIPNHTSMLTGRPALQPAGMPNTVHHGYTLNDAPARGTTLHNSGNPQVDYIASVLDVVHNAGLSTAMYASKEKFIIYSQSYDESTGAVASSGRDKLDVYFFQDDGPTAFCKGMNDRFLADMAAQHFNYVFAHYRDTDSVGHADGWGSRPWRRAVSTVDDYLAGVLHLIETNPVLRNRTAIIITADHGGMGYEHGDETLAENYTIPVIVWGAGVGRGDLYAINADTRTDPGDGRPDYAAPGQPIRNVDTGNLALALLGLGPIPGSLTNAEQDLHVAQVGDYNLDGVVDAADYALWRDTRGSTTDLRADGNGDGAVDDADHELWKTHFGQGATVGQ